MPTALDASPRVYPLTNQSTPMNIYSYSSKDFANPMVRPKRRQVKNACTNCQRACKKCDDARPCLRCVKYGIGDECVDSQRKERKKGVKRGPYKKRDGKDRAANAAEAPSGPPVVASSATPPQVPQYVPMAYPAFYPAYPAQERVQDTTAVVYPPPQYYLAPMPAQQDATDFQNQGYYQPAIYHSAPYMMQRAQLPFPIYPNTVPQKPGPNDVLSPHGH